jgi:hypothetical protein
MKIKKIIEAIKEFNGFKYPWNKYGFWDKIQYPFFKKPYWIFKLMKNVEFYPWDLVNSSIDILFMQYQQFFEKNEEHLKPWLEEGKWQEHKHSENWEGTPKGKGSGLKYRDMLEIYMYIKYIRNENEKKKDELMHLLLCDENYKTWTEDCNEVYDGEKCYLHKHERLANFKVDCTYSKNKITDKDIYSMIECEEEYKKLKLDKRMFRDYTLFADNLTIKTTKLETVSEKYNKDFNALYKIEQELIDLDDKYATWIIKNRQYLWY